MAVPPLGVLCALSLMRRYPPSGSPPLHPSYKTEQKIIKRGVDVSMTLMHKVTLHNNALLTTLFVNAVLAIEKHYYLPALLIGRRQVMCYTGACHGTLVELDSINACIRYVYIDRRLRVSSVSCGFCCLTRHPDCRELARMLPYAISSRVIQDANDNNDNAS